MKYNRVRNFQMLYMVLVFFFCICIPSVYAEEIKTDLTGKVYCITSSTEPTADMLNNIFDDANQMAENNSHNTFSVEGNISSQTTNNEIMSFEVKKGNIKVHCAFDLIGLVNHDEEAENLIDSTIQKVGDIKFPYFVSRHGATLIQAARDGKTWHTIKYVRDAYEKKLAGDADYYSTNDIQMDNGCYYRIVVVYETKKLIDRTKFLFFFNKDNFEYKTYAEVYKFYARSETGSTITFDQSKSYKIGECEETEIRGYRNKKNGDKEIQSYLELGNFFVSGYTDKITNTENGEPVFLKNVGDKIVLWFNLTENIDAINNNEEIKVTADTENYDAYFKTKTMNFGRGTMIVRYTNPNNVGTGPIMYSNFLEAIAMTSANTMVQVAEEGDYEVALDYEITNTNLLITKKHYRIFAKFSVRNGNCVAYPIDLSTGSELMNSSVTENGFRLDLARSRYLKINVKYDTLRHGADGLVNDTRFNGPARDGTKYTQEGIYTIFAKNEITGQSTHKKIYVGKDPLIKAYIRTGVSIPKLRKLVDAGAIINTDGSVLLKDGLLLNNISENNNVENKEPSQETEDNDTSENVESKRSKKTITSVISDLFLKIEKTYDYIIENYGLFLFELLIASVLLIGTNVFVVFKMVSLTQEAILFSAVIISIIVFFGIKVLLGAIISYVIVFKLWLDD